MLFLKTLIILAIFCVSIVAVSKYAFHPVDKEFKEGWNSIAICAFVRSL